MEIEFARRRKTATAAASKTLKRAESGTLFRNTGAVGTVQLLADPLSEDGDTYTLERDAAQVFQFRPNATEAVRCAVGAGAYLSQAAGQAVSLTAAGVITLTKRGLFWIAESQSDKANFAMVA